MDWVVGGEASALGDTLFQEAEELVAAHEFETEEEKHARNDRDWD